MKQTVEEAAKEYYERYKIHLSKDIFRPRIIDVFKAGAEWQEKKSPWISVKERLPEVGQEVILYDKNSIRHYVIGWLRRHKGYNKGMWAVTNGFVEDKDVTHWMSINKPNAPSFDETLEANKDVLERIKEKGDCHDSKERIL